MTNLSAAGASAMSAALAFQPSKFPSRSWIFTFTGAKYDPLNPSPADLHIEDVAHHLSLLNRYTGASTRAYSVAQHSVLVSEVLEADYPELALCGLLHDGPEFAINDINRYVKHQPWMLGYEQVEQMNWFCFAKKWNLPSEMPLAVKQADDFVANVEIYSLNPNWDRTGVLPPGHYVDVEPWAAEIAEHAFLKRFRELTNHD